MYEYVCMNIDVMNMYEYIRMNIDVRVPSLIAGSLPAIMIWHKFLHLLLLTVAAFIFGLYYGRRISIAWISNESDPTRLWSGCKATCLHVKCDTGQHWLDYRHSKQGEWDTRSNLLSWQWWVTGSARTGTGTGRERGHPLNAKCLKMFHLTYFLYCKVLAL